MKHALAVLEVVAPNPLLIHTVVTLRVPVDAKPLALALDLVALEGTRAPSARVSLTWPLVPLFTALPFFFACCAFPLKGLLSPLLLMFWLIIVVLLLLRWWWWRFPSSSSQQQASSQQGSQSPPVKMQRRPCRTLFVMVVVLVWKSTKPGAQRQAPAIGPTLVATLLHHFCTESR